MPWGELRPGDHSHFPLPCELSWHIQLGWSFLPNPCSAVPSTWPPCRKHQGLFPWPGPCPSLPSPAKPHVFACGFHSYSCTPKLPKFLSASASSLLPGKQRSKRLRMANPSPPLSAWGFGRLLHALLPVKAVGSRKEWRLLGGCQKQLPHPSGFF